MILIVIKLILINLIYKPFISFIFTNTIYIIAKTMANIVNIMNSASLCADVPDFSAPLGGRAIPETSIPNNGNNK